jgi:hypothetical protein
MILRFSIFFSCGKCYKTFLFIAGPDKIDRLALARLFIMFAGKARRPLWRAEPSRLDQALFANFRLVWKYLPGTNNHAYYVNS